MKQRTEREKKGKRKIPSKLAIFAPKALERLEPAKIPK